MNMNFIMNRSKGEHNVAPFFPRVILLCLYREPQSKTPEGSTPQGANPINWKPQPQKPNIRPQPQNPKPPEMSKSKKNYKK